jgi:3-hydroxymyristoyl/3-hydroxydecanoyl-(acyl carrier protein) dehydratase
MRFLFVDRILELIPGQLIRGIKHVTRDDAYLCYAANQKLCFMPSLIGEALGQLAAWNVMYGNGFSQRPVAGLVSSASLYRPAFVGETLLLESVIDALDDKAVQYHSTAWVGDEVVFRIDGALGPLLPMADFIDSDIVHRQFTEINRPGDWPPVFLNQANARSLSDDKAIDAIPMLFDRIVSVTPGVSLTAEKRITRAATFFADHFPNKPVLPMTVLLECSLNLAREFVALANFDNSYRVQELRRIKMNGFVYPGDVLVCYVAVKYLDTKQLILNFRSEVAGVRVCVLDVVMAKGCE